MGWLILSGVMVGVAFVCGYAVASYGAWARNAQIEERVRSVAREAAEHQTFTGTVVPVEWVEDRMNWIIARDFR